MTPTWTGRALREESYDRLKKPYYFVAWNAEDNPKADLEKWIDPTWYRVMVIDNLEGRASPARSITTTMFKEDAKAKLEQIKKLIGDEGRYD